MLRRKNLKFICMQYLAVWHMENYTHNYVLLELDKICLWILSKSASTCKGRLCQWVAYETAQVYGGEGGRGGGIIRGRVPCVQQADPSAPLSSEWHILKHHMVTNCIPQWLGGVYMYHVCNSVPAVSTIPILHTIPYHTISYHTISNNTTPYHIIACIPNHTNPCNAKPPCVQQADPSVPPV